MTKPSNQPAAPDVCQIRVAELAEAPFPGQGKSAFRVYFEPEVYGRIWKHAAEDMSVEICGVLVGKWARDADGPYAHIADAIRGEAAKNKLAEVTFTHETWAKINHEMDTRFTHLSIVGWYHSHPNFGVFLSDRDRFIQEHFFAGPGQVAHVVDPVRKTEGVFQWRDGKPALATQFWVGDRVHVGAPAAPEDHSPAPPMLVAPSSVASAAPAANGGWMSYLLQGGIYLLVFLIGFLLAANWVGKINELERQRIEALTMAQAWYRQVRPGLRDELTRVGLDIFQASKDADRLAREQLKLSDAPAQTQEQWKGVQLHLRDAIGYLAQVQNRYCLSPQEEDLLRRILDRQRADKLADKPAVEDKAPKADEPKKSTEIKK